MPKRHRIPGMKAGRSYHRPVCSVDPSHAVQRNVQGEWVCSTCFREFATGYLQEIASNRAQSVGGVELPKHVRDERHKVEVPENPIPNRAARRRLKHG